MSFYTNKGGFDKLGGGTGSTSTSPGPFSEPTYSQAPSWFGDGFKGGQGVDYSVQDQYTSLDTVLGAITLTATATAPAGLSMTASIGALVAAINAHADAPVAPPSSVSGGAIGHRDFQRAAGESHAGRRHLGLSSISISLADLQHMRKVKRGLSQDDIDLLLILAALE
jgi:hypothetical protein